MAECERDSTVLVPVNAADTEGLPAGLVELLRLLRVVVLGYYPVPDQSSPEQIRDSHEAEASAVIEDAVTIFADRGADVESMLSSLTIDPRRLTASHSNTMSTPY